MRAFLLLLLLLPWSSALSTGAKLKNVLQLKVIRKNEHVVFFPSAAYQQGQDWMIPIHGWIFDSERRSSRRKAFLAFLVRSVLSAQDDHVSDGAVMSNNNNNMNENNKDHSEKEILARRVIPFIVDNHRRRKITIRLGKNNGLTREIPERSRKNGHFTTVLRFNETEIKALCCDTNGVIQYQAVTGIDNDDRCFVGTCTLLPPTGQSIISDIDDTIKVSHVLDKKRLLRQTFLEEFEAVPGMAQLYKRWSNERNASFHYVSSSPWQLYPELASFLSREKFPTPASFSLKSVRIKDRSLFNLFADPMVSKISKITSIIETWPQRKFILVGDTGERDPEVYGEICRRYPSQVEKVFLRDIVSGLNDNLLEELNERQRKKKNGIVLNAPDRFQKAFDGVPSNTWSLFTDADAIDY